MKEEILTKKFIIKHPVWMIVLIICSFSVISGLAMVPLIMMAPSDTYFDVAKSVGIPAFLIPMFISTPVVYFYKKIICENLEMIERLQKDPLTGFLNRDTFIVKYENLVEKLKSQRKSVALIMIDIDNFKKINDTYGHLAGDFVINNAGMNIRSNVRSEDLLCRFGGEEFLIVLCDMTYEQAIKCAERILVAMRTSVQYRNQQISFTASIGLVYFYECQSDPEELIRQADYNMYQAKVKGKNQLISNYVVT